MTMTIPALFAATPLALAAVLAVAAPAPMPAAPEEPEWGKPVNGLRLGLHEARGKAGDVRLMVVIENTGGDDSSHPSSCSPFDSGYRPTRRIQFPL